MRVNHVIKIMVLSDFFINAGGIGVNPGRYSDTAKVFYPRVREDAEEYAKHFFDGFPSPAYVSQIFSAPNMGAGYMKKRA